MLAIAGLHGGDLIVRPVHPDIGKIAITLLRHLRHIGKADLIDRDPAIKTGITLIEDDDPVTMTPSTP